MSAGARVLLVSFDARVAEALRACLASAGFWVEVARSEADADRMTARRHYAAVLRPQAPRKAKVPKPIKAPSKVDQLTTQLQRQIALLDSVTRNTDTCLAFLDRDFNFVWVNSSYADKSGHSADELIGRNHFDLFPNEENQAIFERVRETGEPYEAWEKPFEYADQPERGITYWNWNLTAARDSSGEIYGFDFSLVDATAEVRGRRELERLRAETSALLQAARAVLEYSEFPQAARAIFDSCKALLGATAGYVALLNHDGSENDVLFLDAGGLPCSVDPTLPMPIRGLRGQAYAHKKAVYENDFRRSPWVKYMPPGHAELDNVLFAPLIIGERVVGLLGLANKKGGFTDEDARIASAFGELAAVALSNSRTLEALEESEERFRSVAETANDAIVSIDGRGLVTFWNQGAEAMFGRLAVEMVGQPLLNVMPERFQAAHKEGLRRISAGGAQRIVGQTVEMLGLRRDGTEFPIELSLATWKIGDENYFTGIIRDITERKLAEAELAAAREALEDAYRREHRIADTLQRALIPDVTLSLSGYQMAARYQPALKEAEVGGDFYDVFTLADGRVALMMGDVSGKGLQAAVHTAMAKYMLRAYADENPRPGYVLAKLNDAICHYTPEDLFVTIFYGVLDPNTHVLTYGSAGHDGPLVYSPDADGVITLQSTGCAAGVLEGRAYGEGTLKLSPGDVILIYTDGITEARSRGELLGIEGLADAFARCVRSNKKDITEAVFDAALKAGDGILRDDAAVLVLKATDAPTP